MKNKVTLVWDYHGGGRLVGIFDDDKAIQRLRRLVAESGQRNYVRFLEVTVNEVASTSLGSQTGASISLARLSPAIQWLTDKLNKKKKED